MTIIAQPSVAHVRSAFGTGGVHPATGPVVGSVISVIDVHATRDLSLVRFELLDASGAVVGTASGERELRVASADANDFARPSGAFGGSVRTRARLWCYARIDGDFDVVARRAPVRYRLHLRSASGAHVVEGPTSMWPTA